MHRLLLVWIWTLTCASGIRAQLPDYHVQLFDEKYGIRSDMERVMKDKDGFIWLATLKNVYRFDGRFAKEFPLNDDILSLICDKNGTIWANSNETIYQFVNDRLGFVPVVVDTVTFGELFQLPGKEVWALTSTGFLEWNKDEKRFHKADLNGINIPDRINTTSFSTFENTLFFASGDTMYAVDIKTKSKLTLVRWKSHRFFNAIGPFEILITSRGDSSSWADFSNQTITAIDFRNELPGKNNDFLYIRDALSLENGKILIASHSGLLELDKKEKRFRRLRLYHQGHALDPTPNNFDLMIDEDQRVWLIQANGLISFSPGKEVIGLLRDREADGQYTWPNYVRTFVEDDKGNLWIATSEGFGYWDLEKNTITMHAAIPNAKDRLNIPSVRGMILDEKYLIMGTSSGGVWLYDPVTDKYRRPSYASDSTGIALRKKLEVDFIKQIVVLPDGNYFIVGRDCYVMQKGTYEVRELDFDTYSKRQANVYYLGKDNNIWLGTEEGFLCYDQHLNFIKAWNFNLSVTTLHEWEDDTWLVGTYNGLYTVSLAKDSAAIKPFDLSPKRSRISFITKDKGGIFWIGSAEGLIRYDPLTRKSDIFDHLDNIQGNIFALESYTTKEGTMFLGGQNGINYFHPEKIAWKKDSLKITIMKVTVNQDDTSYFDRSQLLSLKSSQNSIEIEFVAPYFGNTNRLQYRYQLTGLSSAWKNLGNNAEVRFTKLPAGEYLFKTAVSLNGVQWFESEETLLFNIAYPFWQTWWFLLCCVIAISTLIFYFVRKRIESIRLKEKVKRDYEKRIAEVEMHALRAQMNPHFMFNSLNSINNFILKNDPDNASGYLTKFSRLMRLILDNSRSEWVMLEHELKALELYIELEIVRFDKVFDYEIIVSPEIDVTTTSVPPMIIQPYVENAIWHGLMHRKEPGGKLIIRLWREQHYLHICIEDNGVGREEAKRQKSKTATRHKSHGMKITAERIEIVNRIYDVNATVRIEDVAGHNGHVGGTRVSLTLADKKYDSHYSG